MSENSKVFNKQLSIQNFHQKDLEMQILWHCIFDEEMAEDRKWQKLRLG